LYVPLVWAGGAGRFDQDTTQPAIAMRRAGRSALARGLKLLAETGFERQGVVPTRSS
jgi:hypothetical protein